MDIYKNQQDRTEIQNQYEYELNQFQEAVSVDNLTSLGFISEMKESSLKQLSIALNSFVLHCDTLDNRIFIFYLNNKQVNLLTMKDVINLINYLR